MSTIPFQNIVTVPVSTSTQPKGIFHRINQMVHLARMRRQMKTLTDTQIADMGLTAKDVANEASRPFWDVPANWRG